MKNSELKEYVNSFPDDAPVSIICANPRKRKLYKLEDVIWVTDQGQPLILIDIGEESDMDAEMVEVCEECERDAEDLEGQMQIEDFPEVMPDLEHGYENVEKSIIRTGWNACLDAIAKE